MKKKFSCYSGFDVSGEMVGDRHFSVKLVDWMSSRYYEITL